MKTNNIRYFRSMELTDDEKTLLTLAPTYKKIGIVHAAQALSDGQIETLEGTMHYKTGDYIVSDDPPTHVWPVRRDIFEKTYEPEF